MSRATIEAGVFQEITQYVKAQRPPALTKEERLDILRLHAYFRSRATPRASELIAEATGRSQRVVKAVWKDYLDSKTVVPVAPPSNTTQHASRIPKSTHITSAVQEFIRNRRMTRTRTVAGDVMEFLFENGFIALDYSCSKSLASAERGSGDEMTSDLESESESD
ncbi:hypothetical protein AC1031_005763 [Aphanomyces cochlioides]|nr:hypothetical protein AC1031_005763 [Aphanomyces cochlioides]